VARLFVRLRLRLLRHSIDGSGPQILGLVVMAVLAGFATVGGFVAMAAARSSDNGSAVVMVVAASLVLGWLTFPLVGFGSGTSLDPRSLVSLPLTRRQLMVGLTAAALVGPGAAITAATMGGAVVGLSTGAVSVVVLVVAAVLQVLVCVALARALTTFLGGALRSRRGRDLRFLAVFLIVLLPQLVRFALPGRVDSEDLRSFADAAGVVPLLWPTRAMTSLADDRPGAAVIMIVGSVVVLVALLLWWHLSLDRVLTTAESGGAAPKRGRTSGADTGTDDASDPLFGRSLGWLPRTAFGAVAARELRLTWRDPRRRINLISSILLPFILVGGFLTNGGVDHAGTVYLCITVVLLAGGKAFNQLGIDGRAWTAHEAAGSDLRADLDGKALAVGLVQVLEIVVVAVALAALSHGWSEVLPAILFAVALSGPQLGIGNWCSVAAPIPVPPTITNAWGSGSPGAGCLSGLLVLAGMAAMVVVAVPSVVAAVLVPGPIARTGVALISLPLGFALYRLLTARALAYAAPRRPEILAKLMVRHT
jgi:ABC-2 type transport system permease protein